MSSASLLRSPSGRFTSPVAEPPAPGELFALWTVAQAEANIAYDAWSAVPGADSYAVFVAATDRADAALDALATA